jgi:TRAP-type C4-dicarboxylate transport system permease small subunit
MTDDESRRGSADDTPPERADEASQQPAPELADSIYPPTKTVFTDPALNKGVPADPGFVRVLSAVEITIGVTLFALTVIGTMLQVLGRYIPALGWRGAGEMALLSMIALTFAMAGYLVGRNGHIVLEMFDGLLEGKKLFAVLRIVSAVIMAATSIMLAYEAFVKIEVEWVRTSAALHLPIGVLYLFALLGFLSAAVHSIFKIPFAHRPERKLDIGEMEG